MARKRSNPAETSGRPPAKPNTEPRANDSFDSKTTPFIPKRIISGGQTGVDRAGLEVAIAIGIEHGGWCPLGRRAEDGSVPSRYELCENDSYDYTVRTRQNVIDSDATLILYEGQIRGGTKLTKRLAEDEGKPHLCVRVDESSMQKMREWLNEVMPRTLNVAGPRESSASGIETRAFELLLRVLQ
jgi:hypothetical protein